MYGANRCFNALLDVAQWAYIIQTHGTYSSHTVCLLRMCSSISSFLKAHLKWKIRALAFKSEFCSSILPWKWCQANSAVTWLTSLHIILPWFAILAQVKQLCVTPVYWCSPFISWWEEVILGPQPFCSHLCSLNNAPWWQLMASAWLHTLLICFRINGKRPLACCL